MFDRRSLKLPITLGVIMIVLLVAVIVGWILLAVFGALRSSEHAGVYWTLLSVGTIFLAFILAGVISYLVLSIKAINLNRRQSNFVDSVTHELKSPIASLKLYLQTMNRHPVSNEEAQKFHKMMLEDVERLDHLINHLLAAGRLEKRNLAGEKENVDLEQILREYASAVCLRYNVPKDCVKFDMSPCVVLVRRVDIDMILRNIIDNAVKYAGSPAEIEIWLRPNVEGNIVVSVSDNGQGIPTDQRRKIFRRFERLGSELTREKPGTGLGLYIVRTLVKRLGGRVSVHDRESGTGTLFQLELPAVVRVEDKPVAESCPNDENEESGENRASGGDENLREDDLTEPESAQSRETIIEEQN